MPWQEKTNLLRFYCSLVEKDESAAKAKFAAMRKDFEQMFGL